MLTQKSSMKRQATTTLGYLHSWSKIQFQVKARRLFMVTEGRLKQKKLENQLKLEAKLHDLDVSNILLLLHSSDLKQLKCFDGCGQEHEVTRFR